MEPLAYNTYFRFIFRCCNSPVLYSTLESSRYRLPVDAITAPAVFHEVRLPKITEQVAGLALLLKLDITEPYRVLGHDGKLLRMADSRTAQILIARGLIFGELKGDGKISNLRVAQGCTVAQIKKAMLLKPSATSISNRATVVKVLPTTWTHRASLRAGY